MHTHIVREVDIGTHTEILRGAQRMANGIELNRCQEVEIGSRLRLKSTSRVQLEGEPVLTPVVGGAGSCALCL